MHLRANVLNYLQTLQFSSLFATSFLVIAQFEMVLAYPSVANSRPQRYKRIQKELLFVCANTK